VAGIGIGASSAAAYTAGQAVRLTKAHPGHKTLRVGTLGVVERNVGYLGLIEVLFLELERPIIVHRRCLEAV
jgi:hypothetical protein